MLEACSSSLALLDAFWSSPANAKAGCARPGSEGSRTLRLVRGGQGPAPLLPTLLSSTGARGEGGAVTGARPALLPKAGPQMAHGRKP